MIVSPPSGATMSGPAEMPRRAKGKNPLQIAEAFYERLRQEVQDGNPHLAPAEQALLRAHYPVMAAPSAYPPALASRIYASRRGPALEAILKSEVPVVLDAGCGFGSESFLFASLGAKVLAVDLSPDQLRIAKRRQAYFEAWANAKFDIVFRAADLDSFAPETSGLTLTWIASVLAGIADQAGLLSRIHAATLQGGQVMVTDMNLLNPLFICGEFKRRRRARKESAAYSEAADFAAMVRRSGRAGARYFPKEAGGTFDDVQFFTPRTIRRLFRETGFTPKEVRFSGFAAPGVFGKWAAPAEKLLGKIPVLKSMGYFYLAVGEK